MNNNIIDGLNEKQKEAVLTTRGPMMIVAGAGSGKTRVITLKIVHLLQIGILPSEILALTFSNKAANEMGTRVSPYCKDKLPMMSTFHSFGYYLIARFASQLGLSKKITVYDTNDQIQLIRELLKNNVYPTLHSNRKGEVSAYVQQQHISLLKNNLLPEQYKSADIEKLRKDYDVALNAYHALDFDDLILKPIELLKMEHIRAKLHKQFKYFLIDEFQDTSNLQFDIISLLAGESRNICVVGDDDQSIYSWRGADLENWSRFTETFPEHKEIILDMSYRCSPTILKAANAIISQGKRMRDKQLISFQGDVAQDAHVRVISLIDEQSEAEYVTDMASIYHFQYDIPWSEIGILTRTNSLFGLFEASLGQLQIPYSISGGSSFFDHMEVKDLLAYLRLIVNQYDDMSCRRIINIPKRGIGISGLQVLSEYAKHERTSLFEACIVAGAKQIPQITQLAQRSCYDFSQFICEMGDSLNKGMTLANCLRDVVDYIKYNEHLVLNFSDKQKLLDWKQDNVLRLIDIIERFDMKHVPPLDILNALSFQTTQDNEESQNALSLMTIHAAKGLEKEVIFVVGMEDGILPHFRSIEENPEQIHEETRLCYVAFTRAKKHLHLTWAQARKSKKTQKVQKQMPSPYIGYLPEDIVSHEIPQANYDKAMNQLDDFLKNFKV